MTNLDSANKVPIRILHVVTAMNRGGLETMLMNFYRNIDRNVVQFDFLVHRSKKGDYDDEVLKMGGKIYRLPNISLKNIKGYISEMTKFFKEHTEYSIVHSHIDALSCIPLKIAKNAHVPVRIAHSHNNNFEMDSKYPIRMLLKKMIKGNATDLFACSSEAFEFMFGLKCKEGAVVNNAIDTSKFKFSREIRIEKRKELGIDNKFVVGHIGRFHFQKNHEFLIDIFKKVYDKDKDAVLVLIGAGADEEKIKMKVSDLGLDEAVKFLGVRSDISDLMQTMDVFVLPSRFEGLGIVLIEAQATGLKCFTSDKVVPEEAKVTDLLEFIALEKSAEFWANEILRYKSGYERKDTTQQIIDAGFEIQSVAKRLQEFYLVKHQKIMGCDYVR